MERGGRGNGWCGGMVWGGVGGGGKGEHTPAGDQSQQGLYGGGDRGLRELGQQWRGVDTAKEARL